MTKAEALKIAQEELRQKREDASRVLAERENEVRDRFPEIGGLLDRRVRLVFNGALRAMNHASDAAQAAQEIKTQGLLLNEAIRQALDKAGLGRGYLSFSPACPLCQDTGYLPDTFPQTQCQCLERRVRELMNQDENGARVRFADFDEQRIPETEIRPGITQRALLMRVKQAFEDYAQTYPQTLLPGIVLSGQTGLGKSFLLRCLQSALEDRGCTVLALKSYKLLERMRNKHFDRDEGAGFDEAANIPILLIDDLGSEPVLKTISEEYLCVLLEERMTKRLHTVITTNLTPPQIQELYSGRVMSRLNDIRYWDHLRLQGSDLRRT